MTDGDLSAGDASGPPPAAFGSEPAADSDPADAAQDSAGEWWGLRNTEPAVTPSQVGADLDVHADWWQHLGAGFMKQSGSGGAEAWMHYVMGVALLVADGLDVDVPGGDSGGEPDRRDADETEERPAVDPSDGEIKFDGPV